VVDNLQLGADFDVGKQRGTHNADNGELAVLDLVQSKHVHTEINKVDDPLGSGCGAEAASSEVEGHDGKRVRTVNVRTNT